MASIFAAARPALRAAARSAVRPAFGPLAVRPAALHTTVRRASPPEVIQERHVPVTTFQDGEVAHEVLQVQEQTGPVNPPGMDDEVAAKPLSTEISAQLTPTMAKFTLHGRVAVVTG